MIFFSKRSNTAQQSTTTETCVSIIGLFLAVGLIGGLAALIYGLVKSNLSGTIGGAIVLGASLFFTIILVLVFIYCLKNNNVNSNVNKHRAHQRQHRQSRHQQQNRQVEHEQTSSHQITVISGTRNHPQQKQQTFDGYDGKKFSLPAQSHGLSDSTNSGYGQQLPQSPSKASNLFLNQSNTSMGNQNQYSTVYANAKRDNHNRH